MRTKASAIAEAPRDGSIGQIKTGPRKGKWKGQLILGDGKRKTWLLGSKAAVEKAMAEARGRREMGLKQADRNYRLADYIEDFQGLPWREELAPRTLMQQEMQIRRHILPYFGRFYLHDISKSDIEHWHGWLAKPHGEVGRPNCPGKRTTGGKGLKRGSIRQAHNLLGLILKQACGDQHIALNPVTLARFSPSPKQPPVVIDRVETRQLLEAIRGEQYEVAYATAILTGMRRGEVCGLLWSDIDMDAKDDEGRPAARIHVQRQQQRVKGKGMVECKLKTSNGNRWVPLPDYLLDLLRRHKDQQAFARRASQTALTKRSRAWPWPESDRVFTTLRGGVVDGNHLYNCWTAMLERKGLEHLRVHAMRHSYATTLIDAGVALEEVSKILGHSTLAITADIYVHQNPKRHVAADKMQDAIFGATGTNG